MIVLSLGKTLLLPEDASSSVVSVVGGTNDSNKDSASVGLEALFLSRWSLDSDNVVVEACPKVTRIEVSSETIPPADLDFLEVMISADKK